MRRLLVNCGIDCIVKSVETQTCIVYNSAHIFLIYIVYMQGYLRWRLLCCYSLLKTYLKTDTETAILHCDTEIDILLLTDIFCIEEACVRYKLALYSPWQRL